jgi:hypothetical protein
MKQALCIAALCGLVVLPGAVLRGQYIERDERTPGDLSRFIAVGVIRRDFTPMGSNTAPDSLRIRYGSLLPGVTFRQSGFEICLAYGRYTANGKRSEMVMLSSTYSNDLPLSGSRALAASLIIGADYAKAGAGATVRDDFNLASVGIGLGLVSAPDVGRLKLSLSVHALMHLSYEAYSARSASSPAVLAGGTVLFPGGPIGDGLALGYRFRWQQWSTGGYFDYRAVNHALFFGVIL